jgi:hypothetical protein
VPVIKRVIFFIMGFAAALAADAVLVPLILMIANQALPEAKLWDWLGMGQVGLLNYPVAFVVLMGLTAAFTAGQAIVAAAITEILTVRTAGVYLLAAAVIALSASLWLDPAWFATMDRDKGLVTLAFLAGSLAGGLVYWAIAGHAAGLPHHPKPAQKT